MRTTRPANLSAGPIRNGLSCFSVMIPSVWCSCDFCHIHQRSPADARIIDPIGRRSVPRRTGLKSATMPNTRTNMIELAATVAITVGYGDFSEVTLFSAMAEVTAVEETRPPRAPERMTHLSDPSIFERTYPE